jgi:hypothetical protein
MQLRYRAFATLILAAIASMCPLTSVSVADSPGLLGGGAGIIVNGTYCTLTTIGHDGGGVAIAVAGMQCALTTIGHYKSGDLVGFTAGHCGGPGATVVADGAEERGPVGAVGAADGDYYAVIKFDPAKVTPVPNYGGFAINGISADPNPRPRGHSANRAMHAVTGSRTVVATVAACLGAGRPRH